MKILIVFSGRGPYENINLSINHPFIFDQINSLKALGVHTDVFVIEGSGIKGYLKGYLKLKNKLIFNNYDIIHAHYGLSGMISVLQLKCPAIITFTGCDINLSRNRLISIISRRLSAHNIFVSERLRSKAKIRKNYSVIPYGVELNNFFLIDKKVARQLLKLPLKDKIVLFASSKDRIEKNYALAEKALSLVQETKLIELENNYTTEQMNLLINASDLMLLTSIREGSPQIIKEAMACNCPIVSTDVGDVKEIIGNTKGCYVSSFDPLDVAEKIKLALKFGRKTNGRQKIKHLDVNIIAKKVINIYKNVVT